METIEKIAEKVEYIECHTNSKTWEKVFDVIDTFLNENGASDIEFISDGVIHIGYDKARELLNELLKLVHPNLVKKLNTL